jgi:hypothetical protein
LKAAEIERNNTACLDGPEQAVVRCASSDPITELLDATIHNGTIESTQYHGFEVAHPDGFGWMREPVIASLRAADLPCPDSLLQPEPYRPHITPPPAWAKPFVGRKYIPLRQAARMLAGVDPTNTNPVYLTTLQTRFCSGPQR